ncbi:hypothetical protein KR009_001923 [Drosophila setifemur]|nr:hypothetical protein KR009_001923 [Drosophila setifemur]
MDTKSNDDSAGSDSLDKSMQIKCVMVETNSSSSSVEAVASSSSEELDTCSRDSAAESAEEVQVGLGLGSVSGSGSGLEAATASGQLAADQKTNAGAVDSQEIGDAPASNSSTSTSTSASCTAFETKVKLISQNLKETSLAESSATGSASGSSNSCPLDPQSQHNSSASSSNSTDDSTSRLKKVRFHPDAKENDGGNWEQNKRRASQTKRTSSPTGMEHDGEQDQQEGDKDEEETEAEAEEEDEEPEEEFDLAKTIAEAEDYLKQHPLTFVNRVEQNGVRPSEGPFGFEDAHHDIEEEVPAKVTDNDEDFYRRIKPENGIERLLGKETKAGKVEFLLRYENQGGLFWESEEFVRRTCPSLLRAYEKNRERRQHRLMYHVANRQTLRQRYTDF